MKLTVWLSAALLLLGVLGPGPLAPAVAQTQVAGPTPVQALSRGPRVWTVDAAGGGHFLDLPDAVEVARSGDLIVVHPSPTAYTGFTTSKALTIVGLQGSTISCSTKRPCVGGSRVHDVAAGEEFVMRGLEMLGDIGYGPSPMTIEACEGPVWLEDCVVQTRCIALLSTCFGDGLLVQDASQVVLVRSSSTPDFVYAGAGTPDIDVTRLTQSSAFLFGGRFKGTFSGPGARVEGGSYLYAAGTSFEGGGPRQSVCAGFDQSTCFTGGSGGHGLVVNGSSDAQLLDVAAIGAAGLPPLSCLFSYCPGTADGMPFVGPVEEISLPARTLAVESPVARGSTYALKVTGQPGEVVFSMYSDHAMAESIPLYFGPRLVADPITFVLEGAIPAGGVLEKEVAVPPLPLLEPFHRSFVQGLLFDTLGNAFLASGSVLVVF